MKEKFFPVKRRQDSNIFSRWTFSYYTELAIRGTKKQLKPEDFALIEDLDQCETMATNISNEFNKQKIIGNGLWAVLYSVYGTQYLLSGFASLTEAMCQLALGYYLGSLLRWFENNNSSDKISGYYYAIGIALLSLFNGVLHHVCFFLGYRTGMRVRIGLIATIYQKCLSLSLSNSQSIGFMVNMVSNDVQRFEDLSPHGNYIWVAPIQFAVAMYLIYLEIGVVFLAPFISLMILIPLQSSFGSLFGTYRKHAVVHRDSRIKSISDMLSGIMIVKLYAWEKPFINTINAMRNSEMRWIWKGNRLKAINESIFFSSAIFINLITFMTYYYIGGVLAPSKVFSVFTYVNFLKLTLTSFFSKAIQMGSECLVSVKRIEDFLNIENSSGTRDEKKDLAFLNNQNEADLIAAIVDGSFAWKTEPVLSDINLTLKKCELVAICGPVGAGKSSLLNVLLHDLNLIGGEFAMSTSKIAYVSQSAWILSGTIKENILFGKPYNESKFKSVVKTCSLETDFMLFSNAENTILGERGVTLSGGQRARVSLARAIYYDADLYLLDDPLSAVDTKVGRQLFENCIKKTLANKCVVLVTHQLQFINQCDKVVIIENGRISASGLYNSVIQSETPFASTIRDYNNNASNEESEDSIDQVVDIEEIVSINENQQPVETEKFLTKEDSAVGGIPLSLYIKYFKSGSGTGVMVLMLFLIILGQTSAVIGDVWLGYWSGKAATVQRENFYPIIYVSLASVTFLIAFSRAIIFFYICLKSTKASFSAMLNSVFRSPMSFFQSVPHGRLMNRFSKDMNLMDEMLPQVFFDFIQCAFMTASAIIIAATVVKYSILLIPFLLVFFYYIRNFYMQASRQIKRLEANTRSPVYSSFTSTLEGLSIIRAFSAEKRFLSKFYEIQDENSRIFFGFLSSGRWLGFRLDMLSSFLVIIFTFGCVFLSDGIPAGSAGLLLSYLLQLTGLLQWCVRQSAELENLMVSAERVFEYSQLPSEAAEETEIKPNQDWPAEGKLEIKNMTLTYPNLENPGHLAEPVINNMTITFEPGMKIGIVGRTGAGKSSFLQALFRIVEPTPVKSIIIDGIATSDLGLYDLRSRISIIPQEPFCFKGTIRFNLDPFNQYADDELWKVLEAVELKENLMSSADKLESEVTENGSNWSFGERQLICLARAILRNSRLIVMDEATSSVDVHTDHLIQKAIRTQDGLFSNSTVLTIAHRLNTVIDYDRILVLDQGKVVEFGIPWEMLAKNLDEPDAWFARMVNEMGVEAQIVLKRIANEKK